MIPRLVSWSTRHPRIVIAAALMAGLAGEAARRAVAQDVLPDLSDPQIVLVADWMGHPPGEVATAVTRVVTGALDGVPGATAVRGSSMSGMAYVDVSFASAAALDGGRKAVLERIANIRSSLPADVRLQISPEATATGWVFQYVLNDPTHGQNLLRLRRYQDEVLRPALTPLPGVAEVASVGGDLEQVLIDVRAGSLRANGLAFSDVIAALRGALSTKPAPELPDLQALPVPGGASPAPRLRDLAQVRLAHDMPGGMADFGGLPAVGGIVIARRGADAASVARRVREALDRERARLPEGVKLLTVYDRSDLIDRIQGTLFRALAEEVAVVVLVILVFLLHPRSALAPLLTLPLVLLVTSAAMWLLGVPATIMSLGGIGIALGLAVDAEVVALEVCHRRLETLEPGMPAADRQARIASATGSFAPAILVSLLIAALSFLPVLAFTGETGRLLRPLALTKTLVILSAALVSLTVAPALRAMLLRGRVTPEFANPITRGLVRMYQPFVHFALTRPLFTLLVAGLALASAVPISLRLGGEFLPRIDEGDLLYMPTTLPGAPADELASQLRLQDRALGNAEEIATVFGKIGRADTATDPAPLSMAETTIRLRPRADWPRVPRRRWYSSWAPLPLKRALNRVWPEESPATTAELVERLDRAVRLPGWASAWTAPARARLDMMATGIRTPVGIRIRAGDPDRLAELGATVRRIVADIPDTRSAVFESAGGEIWLEFIPDRPALSVHHVDLALVRATADLLLKGGQIGQMEKDGRLSRVRVVQDLNLLGPADALREITVRSSGDGRGQPVPLAFLGRPVFVSRPAMVRTEGADLVAYIYVDLAGGTDLLGYVARGQRALEAAMAAGELRLNPEERIEWAGQYRLLLSGARRLRLIVPLVALSMLALLYLQFRSLTEALIVLVSVPFALVGSCWTLYWLRYPLSAPVWVGLLSVIGLAMQTGVVMVVYIDEAFHRRVREGLLRSREDIVAAHAEGTVRRLRPKIMTVTTMAAGLLPLLWAEGAGSEILRRVAAPMIGGLLTSAFLTLEVLPVLYTIWRTRQLRRAQRLGVPIETIVGAVPGWARS